MIKLCQVYTYTYTYTKLKVANSAQLTNELCNQSAIFCSVYIMKKHHVFNDHHPQIQPGSVLILKTFRRN